MRIRTFAWAVRMIFRQIMWRFYKEMGFRNTLLSKHINLGCGPCSKPTSKCI